MSFLLYDSVAAVFAAAGAGLVDAHARQFREQGFDLLPDPLGQHFAGGVFQAGDVVQVVVVELFVDRLEDRLDLGEVANPAGIGVDLAFDMQGDAEGVAVQATAFVPSGTWGRRWAASKMNSLNNSTVQRSREMAVDQALSRAVYQVCPDAWAFSSRRICCVR